MPEGDIRTNDAGTSYQLRAGQWVPVPAAGTSIGGNFALGPGPTAQMLEGIEDFFTGGVAKGGINVTDFLTPGGLPDNPALDAHFAEIAERSPTATALGKAAVAAPLAIAGAEIGGGIAAGLSARGLGTWLLSSLGAGTVAQTALDEQITTEGLALDVGIDAATAAFIGLVGSIPKIAVTVANSIIKSGDFKRTVEPGDLPGSSDDLVNVIQDAGMPITRFQATGDAADAITEASLRRNSRTIGDIRGIDRKQQEGINQSVAEAIGLPPGTRHIDRPALKVAKAQIGDRLNAVEQSIPDSAPQKAMVDKFNELSSRKFVRNSSMSGEFKSLADDVQSLIDEGKPITGNDWVSMRQILNAELDNATGNAKVALIDGINYLDDLPGIPANIRAEYGAAREQWRTVLNLEKGATLSTEGNVQIGQFNRHLQNDFGSNVEFPSRTPANQKMRDIADAFSTRRMQVGPSSGTAENQQIAREVAQVGEAVADMVATGDPSVALARGAVVGGINSLASPLHLAPDLPADFARALDLFGFGGASLLQQEISGNNE